MTAINWESLTAFEQLALLVHPQTSEHRFMSLMNSAFCDESENHSEPAVYTVSGYMGRGPDWFELGRKWRTALAKKKLTEFGFHMAQCEAGLEPPYDGMSREYRNHLQQTFIEIINESHIWGYASAIELTRYNQIIDAIKKGREPGFHKAYYLAFQHQLEWCALELDRSGYPETECVAFVFDEQQEYQGNAKILYDSIKLGSNHKWARRLGSLTFDSDFAREELQAADVWAYESMRYIREVKVQGKEPRWQYKLLQGGLHPPNVKVFGAPEIDILAKREGWL